MTESPAPEEGDINDAPSSRAPDTHLNHDVDVANDLPAAVQLLGSSCRRSSAGSVAGD